MGVLIQVSPRRFTTVAWSLALTASLVLPVSASAGASGSSATFDIDGPTSIAFTADDIWVANGGLLDAVSEFSAATGKLVRVVSAKADRFSQPSSIVATPQHVWIASPGQTNKCSVTELNASDGSLVRVTDAPSDRMSYCTQILLSGSHLWVVGSHITELNSSNDSLVRVISTVPDPDDVAISGSDLWVTNLSNSADAPGDITGNADVYELSALTGSVIRIINPGPDIFNDDEDGVTVSDGHVWISNGVGANPEQVNTVLELNASDGSFVQILGGQVNDIQGNLDGIASNDNSVWVFNSDRVTELSGDSGTEVRSITSTHTTYTSWVTDVAFNESDIWISNDSTAGAGSLTEFNASTGDLIRTVTDS